MPASNTHQPSRQGSSAATVLVIAASHTVMEEFEGLHRVNHINDEIVYEQLKREPKALPRLVIKRKPISIFDYELDDFSFEGYEPHPRIVAPIAV